MLRPPVLGQVSTSEFSVRSPSYTQPLDVGFLALEPAPIGNWRSEYSCYYTELSRVRYGVFGTLSSGRQALQPVSLGVDSRMVGRRPDKPGLDPLCGRTLAYASPTRPSFPRISPILGQGSVRPCRPGTGVLESIPVTGKGMVAGSKAGAGRNGVPHNEEREYAADFHGGCCHRHWWRLGHRPRWAKRWRGGARRSSWPTSKSIWQRKSPLGSG